MESASGWKNRSSRTWSSESRDILARVELSDAPYYPRDRHSQPVLNLTTVGICHECDIVHTSIIMRT
jgi:hypothetical protein